MTIPALAEFVDASSAFCVKLDELAELTGYFPGVVQAAADGDSEADAEMRALASKIDSQLNSISGSIIPLQARAAKIAEELGVAVHYEAIGNALDGEDKAAFEQAVAQVLHGGLQLQVLALKGASALSAAEMVSRAQRNTN